MTCTRVLLAAASAFLLASVHLHAQAALPPDACQTPTQFPSGRNANTVAYAEGSATDSVRQQFSYQFWRDACSDPSKSLLYFRVIPSAGAYLYICGFYVYQGGRQYTVYLRTPTGSYTKCGEASSATTGLVYQDDPYQAFLHNPEVTLEFFSFTYRRVSLPSYSPPTTPPQGLATAIEYFHSGFNHYFVTAYPEEAAALDGGAFGGVWSRTGQSFPVWAQPASGTRETCRFFSESFAPKSSHFYTPVASECSLRQGDPSWNFEGVAFHLTLPNMFGNCPAGSSILYRLYNEGGSGAPNHRYTASRTVFDQMRSQGWTPEGSGSNFAFACIPQAIVSPTPPPVVQAGAEGLYAGSTSFNQSIWGIVLPEGTFYVLYSSPGTNTVAGVVQGTGSFAGGTFGSSNARDFNILPNGTVFSAAVSGTYLSGSSIQGTIAESGGTMSFSAQYSATSRDPASLSQAAGSYTGAVASSAGYQSATFTLTTAGGFAGSAVGCTYSGTANPRSTLNVFDIAVRFNGGLCIFGTSTLYGVAVYDAAARQLIGTAPNANRTDGFLFIGSK